MNKQPFLEHLSSSFHLPSQQEQFLDPEFSRISPLYNRCKYYFQMLNRTNVVLQCLQNNQGCYDCGLVHHFLHILVLYHLDILSYLNSIKRQTWFQYVVFFWISNPLYVFIFASVADRIITKEDRWRSGSAVKRWHWKQTLCFL